jgi:Rnl2 family RNA ligase
MNDTNWKYSSYDKIPEGLSQLKLNESDYRLLKKLDWVVTEKIHGANFGITTDGVKVDFAKRKELLQPGEDFFGYLNKKAQLEVQAREIFRLLQAIISNLCRVTIYGEIFGGEYPHPNVPVVEHTQAVQTGVYYSPNIEYCAFDIAVKSENSANQYLDYDIALQVLSEVGMMCAEPLLIGKFDQAFNYQIEFESTIPQILQLPKLLNNQAEGVVIKPVKSIYVETKNGKIRPIVKHKIPTFAEDNRYHQAQKWSDQQPLDSENPESIVTQEILALVTQNRLNNIISKIGRNSQSQQQLVKLLVWDVIESFNDTEYEASFNNLSNESQQIILNKLEEVAQQLVEDYLR